MKLSRTKRRKNKPRKTLIMRSNVIKYDEMGYALRLMMDNNGEQIWVDSNPEEFDVVAEWKNI